jgi:hypothetical protein
LHTARSDRDWNLDAVKWRAAILGAWLAALASVAQGQNADHTIIEPSGTNATVRCSWDASENVTSITLIRLPGAQIIATRLTPITYGPSPTGQAAEFVIANLRNKARDLWVACYATSAQGDSVYSNRGIIDFPQSVSGGSSGGP